MTFSEKVKEELVNTESSDIHCMQAELLGLLTGAEEKTDDRGCIQFIFDREAAAKKVFTLAKKAFNITLYFCSENVHGKSRVLTTDSLKESDTAKKAFQRKNLSSLDCCKRAYVRGVFLAVGTVVDPGRYYRLEFVCPSQDAGAELYAVLRDLEIRVKKTTRRSGTVLYLNEGEQISDLLGIMGANRALLEFENERVVHQVRGNVQRRVNCETSNLTKTIKASVRQTEDIKFIEKTLGLGKLPLSLAETARLRLHYPDASLGELGKMHDPAIGRSGMNHRMRKLSEIADNLRGESNTY